MECRNDVRRSAHRVVFVVGSREVARGREQIPSRIVDVSEGGLCLALPVWLKPEQNYEISIDVPGTGWSRVHAEIWHIRREESRTSSSRVWVAGAMLVDFDEAFVKLWTATGVLSNDIGSTVAPPSETLDASRSVKAPEPIDTIEPLVYRIRSKKPVGRALAFYPWRQIPRRKPTRSRPRISDLNGTCSISARLERKGGRSAGLI